MKKIMAFLALMVFFLPLSLSALQENEIGPVMRKKIDEVLIVINDQNLTKKARNAAIEKIIDPYFDFVLMAKLSLGKSGWESATPAQRREYVTLFERRIKDSYMSKVDLYKNEKITLDAPQKLKNRIHLNSFIVDKGEKKEVLYKFYRSRDRGWLIYDVDVLGVSIIQTYRSQFAGELQKGSIELLLQKLRKPQA
jgi:phospholipid transport system substrate-binding protein